MCHMHGQSKAWYGVGGHRANVAQSEVRQLGQLEGMCPESIDIGGGGSLWGTNTKSWGVIGTYPNSFTGERLPR